MPGNGDRGFTLIELLVVLLIIGVLAAIAVPVFLNQRAKAQDADAKSAVSVAARAMEVYHQDHDTFAGADVAALAVIEPTLQVARGLTISGTVDTFTVSVDSVSGDGPFTIARTAITTTRSCGVPGAGGCPGTGLW